MRIAHLIHAESRGMGGVFSSGTHRFPNQPYPVSQIITAQINSLRFSEVLIFHVLLP